MDGLSAKPCLQEKYAAQFLQGVGLQHKSIILWTQA
jgi:hypothetical protein